MSKVSKLSETRDGFIHATYVLAKSSPVAWADFIEAFKLYTSDTIEYVTQTPKDEIEFAVGSARRMRDLRNDFTRIEELGRKISHGI